jgi:hypothetical protein
MSSATASLTPGREKLSYILATMPAQWLDTYDQRFSIDIDPRIQTLLQTMLPGVWDEEMLRGQSRKVDEFLDEGLRYGIGGGIAASFVDKERHAAVCTLNSADRTLTVSRKAQICGRLSDIMLFARFFHERFVAGIIRDGMCPTFTSRTTKPTRMRVRQRGRSHADHR